MDLPQSSTNSDQKEYYIRETLKCRANFFYFLYNYVYFPEEGGRAKVTPETLNYNMIRYAKLALNFHDVVMMASRQRGKTVTSAALLLWAANFFPKVDSIIFSFNKDACTDILKRIKFIHENLPDWLRTSLKNKGDKVLSLDFSNQHTIKTKYPSTVSDVSSLARGLTTGRIYVDEVQNIPHFEKIYTSCRPALIRAREQALRSGYPSFFCMTGTPNGKEGLGQPFYELIQQSVNADFMFEEYDDDTVINKSTKLKKDAKKVLDEESMNGFGYVHYHWSYDKTLNPKAYTEQKDLNTIPWYISQKRGLQNNQRRINQELDLIFVGGSNSIFDDYFISNLQVKQPIEKIKLSHAQTLNFYEEINQNDFYLIGVKSTLKNKNYINI